MRAKVVMHARTAVVEIVLLLTLAARCTLLSAQPLAAGPEVQVNTEPVAEPLGLAVDAVEDGSFRLVWASAGSGLSTRLLDRSGQPTRSGGDLEVSGDSISMDTDGGDDKFVVVWGQGYDGHAQWFDHNGAAGIGYDFSFGRGGAGHDVATTPGGGFVVVYAPYYGGGVYLSRLDAGDRELGHSNLNPAGAGTPAVAVDGQGNQVVVWTRPRDGLSHQARGQRFTLGGMGLDPPFAISTDEARPKSGLDAGQEWFPTDPSW